MQRRLIAASVFSAALAVVVVACKKAPDANQTAEQAPAASKPINGNETQDLAPKAAAQVGEAAATMGVDPNADFVLGAATSDMFEVQAGQYAEAHAQSPEVKRFAAEMVKAHTATTAELKGLLPRSGVKVTPPAALDSPKKAMLSDLTGAGVAPNGFDRLYLSQQVHAHADAVALFSTYAKNGTNPDLKAFAARTLPTIQHHLDMAQKLQTALK